MKKTILILILFSIIINSIFLDIDNVLQSEGCVFSQTGKNLAEGKGYTYHGEFNAFGAGPILPISLGIVYKIFGTNDIHGYALMIVYSFLCIIPLFLITNKYFGKKIAVLASIFFIVNPLIIGLSTTILADIPALLFFLWFLYFFDKKNYLTSTIFLALMMLTRRTALAVFLAAMFYLCLKQIIEGKNWKNLLLFPILFILLITPNYLWVYHETGNPFASNQGHLGFGQIISFITGPYFPGGDIEQEKFQYNQILSDEKFDFIDYVWDNKFYLIKKWFISFVGIFSWVIPTALGPVLIIPMLFGIYHSSDKKRFLFLSFLFIIFFLGFYMFIEVLRRYFIVILPFLFIYASHGLYRILGDFPLKKFFIFAVVIILITPAIFNAITIEPEYPEYFRAAEWIKDNLPEYTKFLSRKPQIPYYAGGLTWSHFPMDLNNSISYAHKYDYDYIIFDETYTARLRPDMLMLLDENQIEGLELVYSDPEPKHKVKIWRIKDAESPVNQSANA